MPKGIIKFSYNDVVPGDIIVRLLTFDKGTKEERSYIVGSKYKVLDVDYNSRSCLLSDNRVWSFYGEDGDGIYHIDRRPRYKRRFTSL